MFIALKGNATKKKSFVQSAGSFAEMFSFANRQENGKTPMQL